MCRRSIECVYLTHGLLASRALTPCITPLTAISAIMLHPQNSHSDAASDFVVFCRLPKSPDTGWARLLAGSPQRAALPALNKSSSWSDAAASQAPSDSFSYSFTPHLFLPGLTVPDLRRRLQNRFHTHRHDCYSIACRWTQPGWSLIVDAQVGSRPFRWISFHDSNERASREHVCVLSRFVSIKSLVTSYHLTVIFPSNFLVASTYVF
jgi:hypothetical protein